jgi:DNA-binding protein YbaB
MRSLLKGIGAAAVVAMLATPALADRISFRAAKVSIEVPDNWKSETDGDQIKLADKHEDIAMIFAAVDAGSIKQAKKVLKHQLEKMIDNLTLSDPTTTKINGMDAVIISGDGFLNKVNIDLAIIIMDTPSDTNDLLVFAVGEDAKLAKHKDEVMSIFEHLKPL